MKTQYEMIIPIPKETFCLLSRGKNFDIALLYSNDWRYLFYRRKQLCYDASVASGRGIVFVSVSAFRNRI